VHPNALKKKSGGGSKLKNHEIERLMRIILAQGETIHSQLKKLQEREGQIESIEQRVHDSRTRTAGKDYLLNAYLKYLPEGQQGDASCSSDRSSFGDALETIPDRLQEMLEALTKVYHLNEELQKAEEAIGDLRCQLDVSDLAQSHRHLESARSEVDELRGLNDAAGKEIDQARANSHFK
jgi:prefoldin subunit 5